MADLFRRMWPLDPNYIQPTIKSLIETLHIATVGTIIAIVLAVPVGLLAARNVTPSLPLNLFAKFVFVTSRSINSLVWALLFVAVFGPGPLAAPSLSPSARSDLPENCLLKHWKKPIRVPLRR